MTPGAASGWGRPPQHDEGLGRAARVGTLTHRAIVVYLRRFGSAPPDPAVGTSLWRCALDLADAELGPPCVENRAHRQVLAASVLSYATHLLPPESWHFVGGEAPLGRGRVDVVFVNDAGQILIDEVKTGRLVGLHDTTVQAARYLAAAQDVYGASVVGVRVLSTAEPHQSWLWTPDRQRIPLTETPLLRAPLRAPIRRIPRPACVPGRLVPGERGPPSIAR